MGHTKGRILTKEIITDSARKFTTKSEFKKYDPSAYKAATTKYGVEFFNSICKHMFRVAYSTPQLILFHIIKTLIPTEHILYDTRRIIKPYELDIYIPKYKLAFEYNGNRWHSTKESIRRDNTKQQLCNDNNITLLILKENSRDYENDIKEQLSSLLTAMNKVIGSNITMEDVNNVECSSIYLEMWSYLKEDEVKKKISECENIAEFQKKHMSLYRLIRKSNKLFLLNDIRERVIFSNDEIRKKCSEIYTYDDLIENHNGLYQLCIKRGILDDVSRHMKRKNKKYRSFSDEDLLERYKSYKHKSDVKSKNSALHTELKKRKLL